MPKTTAQWTGLAVTLIIALGCDRDVFYALPIGVMAGGIAAGLIAFDESRQALRKAEHSRRRFPNKSPAE